MSFVKATDPKAFVDWIGTTETLQHAATGHVRTVMLLHQDGSLLAIGHGQSQTTGLAVSQLTPSQQYTRFNNDSVTSSLVASMWNDYQDFAGGAQHLSTFNIEFENGQVAITSIGQLLLCFVASHQIQPGMLRGKMMTIAHTLAELSQIYEHPQHTNNHYQMRDRSTVSIPKSHPADSSATNKTTRPKKASTSNTTTGTARTTTKKTSRSGPATLTSRATDHTHPNFGTSNRRFSSSINTNASRTTTSSSVDSNQKTVSHTRGRANDGNINNSRIPSKTSKSSSKLPDHATQGNTGSNSSIHSLNALLNAYGDTTPEAAFDHISQRFNQIDTERKARLNTNNNTNEIDSRHQQYQQEHTRKTSRTNNNINANSNPTHSSHSAASTTRNNLPSGNNHNGDVFTTKNSRIKAPKNAGARSTEGMDQLDDFSRFAEATSATSTDALHRNKLKTDKIKDMKHILKEYSNVTSQSKNASAQNTAQDINRQSEIHRPTSARQASKSAAAAMKGSIADNDHNNNFDHQIKRGFASFACSARQGNDPQHHVNVPPDFATATHASHLRDNNLENFEGRYETRTNSDVANKKNQWGVYGKHQSQDNVDGNGNDGSLNNSTVSRRNVYVGLVMVQEETNGNSSTYSLRNPTSTSLPLSGSHSSYEEHHIQAKTGTFFEKTAANKLAEEQAEKQHQALNSHHSRLSTTTIPPVTSSTRQYHNSRSVHQVSSNTIDTGAATSCGATPNATGAQSGGTGAGNTQSTPDTQGQFNTTGHSAERTNPTTDKKQQFNTTGHFGESGSTANAGANNTTKQDFNTNVNNLNHIKGSSDQGNKTQQSNAFQPTKSTHFIFTSMDSSSITTM